MERRRSLRKSLVGWVLMLGLVAAGTVRAEYAKGDFVKVKIADVRPTQFVVGMQEVRIRMLEIEQAEEEGDLKAFKKDQPGTVVIGPEGQLFLVDGHHFARALLELDKESMWVHVEKDYSDYSWNEFWAKMREKNFCYLKDQNGEPRSPSDLPRTIRGLKDDPYRTLAWLVRRAGGYENLKMPFQEFQWADFFRSRIAIGAQDPESWEEYLEKAMALARSPKAEHLPGWHGEDGDCAAILAELYEAGGD